MPGQPKRRLRRLEEAHKHALDLAREVVGLLPESYKRRNGRQLAECDKPYAPVHQAAVNLVEELHRLANSQRSKLGVEPVPENTDDLLLGLINRPVDARPCLSAEELDAIKKIDWSQF